MVWKYRPLLSLSLIMFLVPLIIVFTQYDVLHNYTEFKLSKNGSFSTLGKTEREERIEKEADTYFQKECVDKLRKLGGSPARLKWVKVSSTFSYFYLSFCLLHTLRSPTRIFSYACWTYPDYRRINPKSYRRGSLGCCCGCAASRCGREGWNIREVCNTLWNSFHDLPFGRVGMKST
jgi:hypothetical protein